jgi:hypothetical protein
MDELIARLKKATGPDRKLDVEIACAISELRAEAFRGAIDQIGGSGSGWTPGPEDWPLFTASLDAARTLIRGGLRWYVADSDDRSKNRPVAAVFDTETMLREGRIPRSVGATPAIALSIAAIKYIQHGGSDG